MPSVSSKIFNGAGAGELVLKGNRLAKLARLIIFNNNFFIVLNIN
jgi:hypothetical protein